jgi:hypothetical protein
VKNMEGGSKQRDIDEILQAYEHLGQRDANSLKQRSSPKERVEKNQAKSTSEKEIMISWSSRSSALNLRKDLNKNKSNGNGSGRQNSSANRTSDGTDGSTDSKPLHNQNDMRHTEEKYKSDFPELPKAKPGNVTESIYENKDTSSNNNNNTPNGSLEVQPVIPSVAAGAAVVHGMSLAETAVLQEMLVEDPQPQAGPTNGV